MINLNLFKVQIITSMNIDNQELQTFLIEAELINQKVKALAENKISTEQFDKYASQREADKQRKEEYKARKQRQSYQAKVKGRDGKGITKDFSHFCRHCHKEYELQTPTCLKCNRPTMALEQRQQQLSLMVEDYKYNKKNREQKRQKWQMFQKTQASMWKKSSINYNRKWQYFVEDSQEQTEKQPILPKNDPNFRALEMDIEERKKKRAKDTEKAKNLKQKGNKEMKQGNYQKATQYYTLALEHIKDMKSIYTNRALAYIKIKKFKKAIKDCTNVIEFMEVFEKVGENKDTTFKAYSRRALAKKQIKEYKSALQDVVQSLKLFPDDKNALLLKKQIQDYIKHTQSVERIIRQNQKKEEPQPKPQPEQDSEEQTKQNAQNIEKEIIKQLAQKELQEQKQKNAQAQKQKQKQKVNKVQQKPQNPIKQIPKRLSELNQQNVQYLFNLLIKSPELKSIFIQSKGIEALLQSLFKNQLHKKEALLVCYCCDGQGVAQKRILEWGYLKFYEKILSKFQDETKLSQSTYDFIDSLLQILVPVSLYQPCRLQLSKSIKSYDFVNRMFPILITKYKKQPILLDNFFILISNLCEGSSPLKNNYLKKEQFIVMAQALFVRIFDEDRSKNRNVMDLKQTIFSLISNIITNLQHRKAFVEYIIKSDRIAFLKSTVQSYPRYAHNFEPYIENLFSLLANASLETELKSKGLSEAIFDRFIAYWQNFNPTIIFRGLLALGRFKYDSNENIIKWMQVFDRMIIKLDPLTNKQEKNVVQIVKILNVLFSFKQPESPKSIPANLFKALTIFVKSNLVHQNLFCNTCNLFGMLIQSKNQLKEQVLVVLRESIQQLVLIAKDKTGNWRKSAAILIAKTSGDPKCRSQIDRTHGMQVLQSIASFVTDKK